VTVYLGERASAHSHSAAVATWLLRAALALIAPQVLCSVAYLLSMEDGVGLRIVDLNAEASLPAWWGGTLLLTMAAVAAALAALERLAGKRAWHWALLSLGFVGLSIEEVAAIHERLGDRFDAASSGSDWVFLYLPLLLAGASILVMVIRDLPKRRATMVAVGLALFASVVAIELSGIVMGSNVAAMLYEENAELAGHIVILLALAWQLMDTARARGLRVTMAS
jgi:hypothetical protein